jgi:regulatory protein
VSFGRPGGGAAKPGAAPKPRPVTEDWLFRAGAHYLERYASSLGNLRRVLVRKVERRVATHAEPPDEAGRAAHAAMIEAALARFAELKLVDDASFAESKLRSLRRAGTSTRQAQMKLAAKGVDRETVAATVAADETSEREAAHRYAKRRRLGPHRTREREERRERDVAAMMRAGFGYADARAAVDGIEDDDGGA